MTLDDVEDYDVWMTDDVLDDVLDDVGCLDDVVWRFRWRWTLDTFWLTLDDILDECHFGWRCMTIGWRCMTFWMTLNDVGWRVGWRWMTDDVLDDDEVWMTFWMTMLDDILDDVGWHFGWPWIWMTLIDVDDVLDDDIFMMVDDVWMRLDTFWVTVGWRWHFMMNDVGWRMTLDDVLDDLGWRWDCGWRWVIFSMTLWSDDVGWYALDGVGWIWMTFWMLDAVEWRLTDDCWMTEDVVMTLDDVGWRWRWMTVDDVSWRLDDVGWRFGLLDNVCDGGWRFGWRLGWRWMFWMTLHDVFDDVGLWIRFGWR